MNKYLFKFFDWLTEEDKKESYKEGGFVEKVEIEKSEEDILAEKIVDKIDDCRSLKLLKRCYKVHSYTFESYVYFNNKAIIRPYGKESKEYLETFYQYLSKAVDRINDHVEKKQEKRRQMELKCMKEFINDK